MFKVDVVMVFLLLTPSVSIFEFEQVNASWKLYSPWIEGGFLLFFFAKTINLKMNGLLSFASFPLGFRENLMVK